MRTVVAGKGVRPGLRVDEYLASVFPALPKSALYKAFRKKDVKIGDRRVAPDAGLSAGDEVSVYLPDAVLFGGDAEANGITSGGAHTTPFGFSVAYEDDRVLIANKPQGLPVHPDRNVRGITLVELVKEYITEEDPSVSFIPALCHRIDRNTGGLVAIAKDREALAEILRLFSAGDVEKAYRCVVKGRPEPPGATQRGYISKDAGRGIVSVRPERDAARGLFEIITRYKTISYDKAGDTSKLEISLLTGRTHQIRAHLASLGHPIIGDGKYCPNQINKLYGVRYQMLAAYKLRFPDMPGYEISGRTIEIPDGLPHPQKYV